MLYARPAIMRRFMKPIRGFNAASGNAIRATSKHTVDTGAIIVSMPQAAMLYARRLRLNACAVKSVFQCRKRQCYTRDFQTATTYTEVYSFNAASGNAIRATPGDH